MKLARLYETPEQFSEMMMMRLEETLAANVSHKDDDPLLLEVAVNPDKPEEKFVISLHQTYQTYVNTGDLNITVEYLNNLIRTSKKVQSMGDSYFLDPSYIYPAIRDERYVLEAGRGHDLLSDEYLPGLRLIYLEIADGVSKMINGSLIKQNSPLDEEKVRSIAFANLKAEGWQKPRMSLKVPFRQTCTVDVFLDNPYPVECQFLLPEWKRRLPANCVITFTNRQTMMLMRSTERMDTLERASKLVEKTRFAEVVQRSYHLMPDPVSQNMYWVHHGEAHLME